MRGQIRKPLSDSAKELATKVRLSILILGPGPDGGAMYLKRCHIRDLLTKEGHDACFCEEVWTPEVLRRSGLNLSVAEFIHARGVDYILCLMASPGSCGEVHDFARDRQLSAKMMICIDQCHKGGYSARGVIRIFEGNNGKVDWFKDPEDVRDCHVATRVLEQVDRVAEAKQWELATGGIH